MNNANLQAEMIRSQIKVAELAQKNAIALQTDRMKLMQREDIKTEKEYHQTFLSATDDGRLILQVQRFGAPLSGALPIRNVRSRLLVSSRERNNDSAVMEVSGIIDFRGTSFSMYIPKDKISDPRYILAAFRSVGVDFHVNPSKEGELGIRIINFLLSNAQRVEIPPHSGWYKVHGEWKYAMPDDVTMEEIEKCI